MHTATCGNAILGYFIVPAFKVIKHYQRLLDPYKKKGEVNGLPKRPSYSCRGFLMSSKLIFFKKSEVPWDSTVTGEGKT